MSLIFVQRLFAYVKPYFPLPPLPRANRRRVRLHVGYTCSTAFVNKNVSKFEVYDPRRFFVCITRNRWLSWLSIGLPCPVSSSAAGLTVTRKPLVRERTHQLFAKSRARSSRCCGQASFHSDRFLVKRI